MIEKYDVLVIGGGLVGATLALALADQPIKIGIVESSNIYQSTNQKNQPALALSKASVNILSTLGLSVALQAVATTINTVHVSSVGQLGQTRISAADIRLDSLGQVIPAQSLLTVLRDAVRKKSHIKWLSPAHLQHLERTDTGYRVAVKMGEDVTTLDTNLLVAADGSDSLVRNLLGIAVKTWNPLQTALTAILTTSQPHQGIAYERFAQSGPLAALPLPGQQYALVWVLSTAQSQKLYQQDDAAFLRGLQQAWGYRLGRILQVENRQALKLHSLCALQQVAPGAVLLGNAAHTLHPIAAQGLNLSLRDTAALAQILIEAIKAGQNPGALMVLEKYRAWREPEQTRVLRFTEALNNIFSSTFLPVKLARNAGLCGLGMMSPIRNMLAKQAIGLSGKMPKLICGLKY
ncbi:MAG TPA: FAD-dependent monooxygenase [Gammaproteobacteria bacterium]|nr:FAD-dependent monooxygenase [Gammaproteobacteria bacterium]